MKSAFSHGLWHVQLPRCVCRYDHVCKLWDVRQQCAVASVDHGAPVESSTFFPSGWWQQDAQHGTAAAGLCHMPQLA